MFARMDHIAFHVKDRNASIAFYERCFGFKKYYEHDVPVPGIEKIVYLKLGESVIELLHTPNGPTNSGFHFCLISDDFDGDVQRLHDMGVTVMQEPHQSSPRTPAEEGWRRVVFEGPDGEAIEFRG